MKPKEMLAPRVRVNPRVMSMKVFFTRPINPELELQSQIYCLTLDKPFG